MSRIVITEEPARGLGPPRFSDRHPLLTYVFGDMVRGFYVIGALALDLFAPLQVHASFPEVHPVVYAPIGAGIAVLAYAEFRVYRRLWPAGARRRILEVVEGKAR